MAANRSGWTFEFGNTHSCGIRWYTYQFSSEGISSLRSFFSETEKVSGGGSYGFEYG